MTQKQVAVIGGGIAGVCTAYFLAEAGHDVVVIERHSHVAQGASYANSGTVAPAQVAPWATPAMRRQMLASLFGSSSLLLQVGADRSLRRWLRHWLAECEMERYEINKARMQRVAFYNHHLLHQLRDRYQIDYEETQGVLQLFRTEKDWHQAEPAIALLAEAAITHQVLDAPAARRLETALATDTPLAGALHLPGDEAGNCPSFARRLSQQAEKMGVSFLFSQEVQSITPTPRGVSIYMNGQTFNADAAVVAAGADSVRLLQPLGMQLPVQPIKTFAVTASIKNIDRAPHHALIDETCKITITRLGSRLRLAGIAELGARDSTITERAHHLLVKTGSDWVPDVANFAQANFWSGFVPMLPDGPPLVGATTCKNVYLNIGHGLTGWAMPVGCGKLVADIISGRTPEIDMDGLTMSRYG